MKNLFIFIMVSFIVGVTSSYLLTFWLVPKMTAAEDTGTLVELSALIHGGRFFLAFVLSMLCAVLVGRKYSAAKGMLTGILYYILMGLVLTWLSTFH